MNEEQSMEVMAKMRALDFRMDELEEREELFWRRRNRKIWLSSGDKNTSFFHVKAKQRQTRNNITSIRDEASNLYEEEEHITEVFRNFF